MVTSLTRGPGESVRLRKRESDELGELYKALGTAQMRFSDITKSGAITYKDRPPIKYAKIDDLVAASRAALHANNLVASSFNLTYPTGATTLVTRLYHHPSSQFIESELPLLHDETDQDRGKSNTYAWRYTYAPLMGLVDNSCDDDGGK
jgi:hypothetical protein